MVIKGFINKIFKSDYTTVLSFDMIAKVLMAVVTVLLIRLMSKEDYAIYTNFSEVAGLVLSIVGTGLSIPFVTYSAEQISRGNNDDNSLFNTCCLLMMLITVGAFCLFPIIMDVYNLSFGLAIMAVAYGGLQSLNKLAQSSFQAKNEFKRSGYVSNFKNVSLLVCVFAVFIFLRKISASTASWITTLSALIAFIACVVWIWKDNKSVTFRISAKNLKLLFADSKWLVLYLIFQSLFGSVCIVILNKYGTEIDVANFGVANKYYGLMLMFLASLQTVLRVKTCQKEMVDSAEKRKEFSINWIKNVFPFVFGVVFLAELSAGVVLPLLNGEGYEPAVSVFRVLMIAVFFGYLFSPNTSVLIAAKRHKLLLVLAIIGCVVGGAVCYLLLSHIGVVAAAIAIVLSNLILNGVGFLVILKR